MNFSFPMPVQTPFTESATSKMFSMPWERFFKAVSDDLIDACLVKNTAVTGFKYVLNGNLCVCNYYQVTPLAVDTTVVLPFAALLAFQVGQDVYPPGTKSVILPAGTAFEQFMFIAQLVAPGQTNI